MKTFNRKPYEIDTSLKNISRYDNQLTFTGIKQSKNIYEVDQKSQMDALNVYINDENTLVSREPLVEDTVDIELDGELIDIKETNGVKVYISETETNYKIIAKRDDEIAQLIATEYHLAIFNQYIICFRTEGARVIDTNNDTLVWSDFSTVTADIVSKVTIGPDIEEHDKNQFTDGYIERYIRTRDIQTVLPMDTSAITTYTVKTTTLTVKDITIDEPWRYTKERLFKPVYSIDRDLVEQYSILAADNIVIIPMDEHFMLSYDYGTTFVQVTYPFIGTFSVANPSLSEDGKSFYYISDRLYRFALDTQQWISYSIYNSDGSEIRLTTINLTKFVNGENFMFANTENLYIKSLNISYDGYKYDELIVIPLESDPRSTSLYMKVENNKTTCGIVMYSTLGNKTNKDWYLYQVYGDTSNALIINKQLLNLSGLSSTTRQNQIDIDKITGENVTGTKNWLVIEEFKTENEDNISYPDSRYIWTDGFDYYYDTGGSTTDHYKWDKATKVWKSNTWYDSSGNAIYLGGDRIWKCEDNIYYDNNYVLNKNTMRWVLESASNGYTPSWIKQFGYNNYGYYSDGNTHKIRSSGSWGDMLWELNNETVSMESRYFWTDGKNLYYSKGSSVASSSVHYKLIPGATSNSGIVEVMNWTGFTNFTGQDIYHINGETYCKTYKLNTLTNTWESSNVTTVNGQYVREVDNNYYCIESSSNMYKLDYLYSSMATLRYVSNRGSNFTYRKNILTIEKNNISSTTDEQIFATSDSNFSAQITKLNDGNYIYQPYLTNASLGKVYGSYQLYSIPQLNKEEPTQSVIKYIPVSNGLYIITNDGENYNILSNILVEGERFEVDYRYGSTGGYYNKVPTLSYSGSELYLVFNNELQITKNEKIGTEINFNLPEINNQSFANKITNLINISTTELALFFEDNVQICTKSNTDSGEAYLYSKTRLSLGVRYGDDVINTLDGANSIFPTIRGLAIMNYQAYMATTDQMLTFISDNISELWNNFYNKSTNIKIVQMRNYIYMSNGTNEYLMFDTRTASWWKFKIPVIVNKLITNQNILNIISTKLYKLDKQFNTNKYYDCDDSIIDWYIISQRLHLGAINHYKNLKQLIFQLVQSNNFENTINTEIKLYRKTITYKEPEMIRFKIDEYKTVVKRFNYWKINELQWALSNDTETATPAQLILNGIDIKYEIGEEVR